MNWDHFRFVLAVSRAGSLSGAGRRLGVDQTTVSRRLAALEDLLEARLFDRIEGALFPTPFGLHVIDRAASMEIAAEDTLFPDGAGTAAGPVRLTAVPWLINRIVTPAAKRLLDANPGLSLSLLPESRNLNLTRREADMALRLSQPEGDADASTRRIGRIDFVVCRPARTGASALSWIGYDESARHLPQSQWIDRRTDAPLSRLRVADLETALAAVVAGEGRTLLPRSLALDNPDVVIESDRAILAREIWLVTFASIRRTATIAAVTQWLEKSLRAGNLS